ncbi:alternate-type signal peptide domain-containing protein [Diaminobutyricimonas sp. LJ205]|uniref:alternate-type signal peptide domain-containing protein n=1 Tax=Diaminobutyricimonas sp. LJ205 TaxID=2683590 RepID=UPI0012F4B06B|nr:alternate-type signal peptide domain-containing protein [Diaminobutyricimonas sp. LJ205]
MNKLVKGSIAGAAGIALLLGGASTFALWNAEATVAAGEISVGKMTVSADQTAQTWAYVAPAAVSGTAFNPATQKLVPGTTVVLTQPLRIDAEGANLKADFGFDLGKSDVTAFKNAGGTLQLRAYDGATEITTLTGLSAAQASAIDRATLTVIFPDTISGTTGQNVKLALTEVNFTIAQK